MEGIKKYLARPRAVGETGCQERGEIIVWMRDQLNGQNKRDNITAGFFKFRQLSAGEVAKRVQGIKTHDLGRDLYYLKGKMEEALKDGFPVGAVFYSEVKKLREGRFEENKAL